MLAWLRPYKLVAILALLALVVSACAELAIGQVVRSAVDRGLTAERSTRALLVGMGALGVVYAVSTFLKVSLISWLGERIGADLRSKLFGHVIGMSPSFFDRTRTSEVLSRLVVDTSVLQTLLVAGAPAGLHDALLLAGSSTLMIATSPKLAGVILASVPLLVLPAFLLGKRVRRLSAVAQDRLAGVHAAAAEHLSAATTVQAFQREPEARNLVDERVEAAFVAARRRFHTEATLATLTVLLIFGLIAGVLTVGARDLQSGALSAGELTAFVLYAFVAARSFGGLTAFYSRIERATGSIERLQDLLGETDEIPIPAVPSELPEPPEGRIELDRVTFSYPSRPDDPALTGLSLEVGSGEMVALVGPSGAGKSSIFNLLLRFYDPKQGCVRLDGIDLRDLHPKQVRSRVGLVAQEPVIFDASIAENIRFGRAGSSDEEVRAAARAAAASGFIEALPEGFATQLGERGVRLSAGQRQRLAIARALLRDPAILLLDEATSALDAQSEHDIQTALDEATSRHTTLVIAHRLATVRKATRIVVLDQGRVVASGTHEELLRRSELYARLARLQFVSEATPSAPAEVLPEEVEELPVQRGEEVVQHPPSF
jgi:ATP-binding cassette subfamily B protein